MSVISRTVALVGSAALAWACCACAAPASLDTVEIIQKTTEYQRTLLVDGQVTFAEYEQATRAATACIKDGGIDGLTVNGPAPKPGDSKFLIWDVQWEGSADDKAFQDLQDRIGALKEQCQREYELDVSRVWHRQHALEPERRDALKLQVVECLKAEGASVDAGSTYEAIIEATVASWDNQVVRACHAEYFDFFEAGVA